jgi:hypothetical protein
VNIKHSSSLLLIGIILLPACHHQAYSNQPVTPIRAAKNIHDVWDQDYRFFVGFPTPAKFSICHDLSCSKISHISLQKNEWQQVTDIFSTPADHGEQERQQIQSAIALLETLVGRHAGTSADLAESQLQGSRQGQLDCIDEATNTTVYLRLLEHAGLLHWHHTAPRTSRGLLSGQVPHTTATIIETASNNRYAVDAWFDANGEIPAIVPLQRWQSGWRPEF